MQINFNRIESMTFPGMNDGTGTITARMYNDDSYRIIPTAIHPGGSIGNHKEPCRNNRYTLALKSYVSNGNSDGKRLDYFCAVPKQASGDDMNYIISGTGRAICDEDGCSRRPHRIWQRLSTLPGKGDPDEERAF